MTGRYAALLDLIGRARKEAEMWYREAKKASSDEIRLSYLDKASMIERLISRAESMEPGYLKAADKLESLLEGT